VTDLHDRNTSGIRRGGVVPELIATELVTNRMLTVT
jgi:hypothetical protein